MYRILMCAATGALFVESQAIAQTPALVTLTTSWGEPDLQGIWTDEFDTPLQRSVKYSSQEFFTEAMSRTSVRRLILKARARTCT
jgi:hypothetical protein